MKNSYSGSGRCWLLASTWHARSVRVRTGMAAARAATRHLVVRALHQLLFQPHGELDVRVVEGLRGG
jgi:hypothetical protein